MRPSARERSGARVLVVGYRTGLGRALDGLGVPFAIWNDRPLRRRLRGVTVRVQPFGESPATCRKLARTLRSDGPFSHVIAGKEAAVVAASYARRELEARRSVHTTVTRCHDKLFMKQELQRHGIPMTDFVDPRRASSGRDLVDALGVPLVIKERRQSGGRGLAFVTDPERTDGVGQRSRIAERFVDAPEVSVESFVNHGRILFENVTEYDVKGHSNILPAALPAELRQQVVELSRRVISALRIDWGMTHLEVYLTEDGPLFGEVALRPPGGYIMDILELAYGFDAWTAYASVELDRPFSFPERPKAVAAALVLHPGPGRVKRILGWERIRADPHVRSARLKIEAGDQVAVRAGAGDDVGRLLFRGNDRSALLASLRAAQNGLMIEMAPP